MTKENLNYHLKKLEEQHQKKDAKAKSMQLVAERTQLIGVKVPATVVVEISDLSGSSNLVAAPKAQQKQQQTSIGMQFEWILPIAFNCT